MKFIDEMRERPEDEKMAFSVIVAGAVALVLFFVWGATFFRSNGENIARIGDSNQQAAAIESIKNVGSGVSSAVNEFSSQYNEFKKIMKNSQNTTIDGTNTVDLSVDKNGEVKVKNIRVKNNELNSIK